MAAAVVLSSLHRVHLLTSVLSTASWLAGDLHAVSDKQDFMLF